MGFWKLSSVNVFFSFVCKCISSDLLEIFYECKFYECNNICIIIFIEFTFDCPISVGIK